MAYGTPFYRGGNRPGEERLVVELALQAGSPVSTSPILPMPCPNTHGTLTPWSSEGHIGLSCYVQRRVCQVVST